MPGRCQRLLRVLTGRAVHNFRRSPHGSLPIGQHQRVPSAEPLPTPLHRATLLASGVTDDEIRMSQRRGTWQRLHRGVYLPTESLSALGIEQRHRLTAIAVAQRSPHLVLSHASAAVVLGLPVWGLPIDRVHLTRTGHGGARRGPGRIVHAGSLAQHEIIRVGETAITSVARTLIDIGCTSSFETTVIAADHALGRLVSPFQLADDLAALRNRHGAAIARRALLFADGRSESVGESRTRVAMDRLGLSAPVLQVNVYSPRGTFLGRSDLGCPDQGVLIEFDGRVKYLKPLKRGQRPEDVVADEKRREDELRGMGYLVVRFVWPDLRDPAAMAARITRDLERGRRIVAAGGITGRWEAKPSLQVPSALRTR